MKTFKFLMLLVLGLGVFVACEKRDDVNDQGNPTDSELKTQRNPAVARATFYTMIHGTEGDDLIDLAWTPIPPGGPASNRE